MLVRQYEFRLFADYFQFYVEDEPPAEAIEHIWDKTALEIGLATAKGIIAVGTERNYYVPVSVEIHDSQPEEDLALWDKVNECSIDISSGTIVIFGCTDYRPEAARIQVVPGFYRVRIYYGGLESVSDFNKGDDHYRLALWAAPYSDLRILKSRKKQSESWPAGT